MRGERLASSEKSRKGGNRAVQARTRPVVLLMPLAMSIRGGSEQCAVPTPQVRYDIASEYPQSPSYHLIDDEASGVMPMLALVSPTVLVICVFLANRSFHHTHPAPRTPAPPNRSASRPMTIHSGTGVPVRIGSSLAVRSMPRSSVPVRTTAR